MSFDSFCRERLRLYKITENPRSFLHIQHNTAAGKAFFPLLPHFLGQALPEEALVTKNLN